MLRRRSVPGGFLLILAVVLGFAASARSGELFRFVEPEQGTLVIGPTTFAFGFDSSGHGIERIDVYVDGSLVGSALPPHWTVAWAAPDGVSGAPVVAVAYSRGAAVGRRSLKTLEVAFGDEIEVNVVQLYPVVVDRRGRFILDLGREDFQVLDNGRPVVIESFATEATTLSIVVLLDVSGSMVDRLGLVQDASCGFIDRLRPGDRVAVAAFNETLRRVEELTADHARARAGVRSLRAAGGTALYDALMRVLDGLRGVPGRRAVFLFSDGIDEDSLSTLDRVVATARKSEAIVYAVGAGEDAAARGARADLRLLAEETGGEARFIERIRDLPEVFDQVLSHLRAQYVLSYQPPPEPIGLRSLEVRVEPKNYTVRCRRSYVYESTGESDDAGTKARGPR